jgi:hypothetical protein
MATALRGSHGLPKWGWLCAAVLLLLALAWVWQTWADSQPLQPSAARTGTAAATAPEAAPSPAPEGFSTIEPAPAQRRTGAIVERPTADPCHADAKGSSIDGGKPAQPPTAQAMEARLSQLRIVAEQRPQSPAHPAGSADPKGHSNHLGELAALALQASLRVEQDFNASRPATTCDPNDAACRQRAQQRYQIAIQSAYTSAATQGRELALRSGEPVAFQLALHLCAANNPFVSASERRECSYPLLQAWVAREADNTTPWLMLAALERETGNGQAADEALYRASIASRLTDGAQAMWGLMANPAFAPEGGPAAAELHQRWAALMAALSYSSLGNVASLCSESAVQDGNLRQRCDALAQRMVAQRGQMIHRVEGLAIAHRLGWPEERLSAQRLQVHRMLKAESAELQTQAAAGPCRSLQAQRARAAQIATQGEVARLEAIAARAR